MHIHTMLNDVAHFTGIKREVAHCDKKVGHPGYKWTDVINEREPRSF